MCTDNSNGIHVAYQDADYSEVKASVAAQPSFSKLNYSESESESEIHFKFFF